MFILSNFLFGLADVVRIILVFFWWVLLIRVLISWVNPDPFNPVVHILYRMTEPILDRIRRVLPPSGGMDFSPIIAFALIVFLQSFLVQSLIDLAHYVR